MRLLISNLFCTSIILTLVSLGVAQQQENIIANPGFEQSGFSTPWNDGSATTVSNTTTTKIEGDQCAQVDHGGSASTTGFSQNVPISLVETGGRYILSANVKHEGTTGNVKLIARFNDDSSTDVSATFDADVDNWEKVQLEVDVPSNATALRVFCRFEGTTGKSYIDLVKMVQAGEITNGENLLDNEDFEDASQTAWNLVSGASISTDEKKYGSKSLKIVGASSTVKYATQFVSLSSDKPLFTISAHILTTGTIPSRATTTDAWKKTGTVNTNVTDLSTVAQVGAAFKIDCFDGSTNIRTLLLPSFYSKSTKFTEYEYSFLVPENTDGIVVTAMVANADGMTAYFDNFRLTKWEASPPSGSFVENTGFQAVEAPEAGTYVLAETTSNLQTLIDNATDSTHADYGKIIWVAEGTHSVNAKHLYIETGTYLKIHQDAIVRRSLEPDAKAMYHAAQLRNSDEDSPVSDIVIEGGVFDNDDEWQGSVVGLTGDRVVIRNLNIPTYSRTPDANYGYSASALYGFGNHWYIYQNSISGPLSTAGHDGIHHWGGSHVAIMSNEVLAGDDAIGIFPLTNFPSDPTYLRTFYDRDISEIEMYNNVLDSVNARSIAVGLAIPRQDAARMISSVKNIRARNFDGLCGGHNQMIMVSCVPATEAYTGSATTPSAQVEDIRIENGKIEGHLYDNPDPAHPGYTGGYLDSSKRYPLHGIQIYTRDVGWVKDIWFENVSIKNFESDTYMGSTIPSRAVFVRKQEFYDDGGNSTLGQDNSNIRFKSCTIDQSGGPTTDYVYQIDGIKWTEVGVLEHTLWYNTLLGSGLKDWTDY